MSTPTEEMLGSSGGKGVAAEVLLHARWQQCWDV